MAIDLTEDLIKALASPEIAAQLKSIVASAMKEARSPTSTENTLLNTEQAAQLMGMTAAAVRKAAQRGTLPCMRLGRNLRFRRDELLASVRR
jgi:excisionase family DNA binding protein